LGEIAQEMLLRINRTIGETGMGVVKGSLILALFCCLGLRSASANESKLNIAAQAAVLMEMQTGKILWAKNRNLPLPPASTAKILTALVVLEHSHPSESVTIPIGATSVEGSTVQLQGGERVSVRNLLYALLVQSANDAALGLASHISGSETKFAALMDKNARSLGAVQSHFLNSTGLPQKGQVTTARDLAVITRAAMANPEFRRIVTTKSFPWKSTKWEGELQNSNALLGSYNGAVGVKTGYTKESGFCLVAAAERGREGYIAVVLKSQEKTVWEDAKTLLDYAFNHFASVALLDRGETVITSVVDGEKVPLAAATGAHLIVPSDDFNLPQIHIALDELEAPIAKGEKVGEAVFHNGDREIARVDLVATIAVPERLRLIWIVTTIIAALILALLFLRLRAQRRRNRYIFVGRGDRLRLR
jgi:D-alanyl-D-alanine carboxypeptidase (penicillin-binding protein 5/6)